MFLFLSYADLLFYLFQTKHSGIRSECPDLGPNQFAKVISRLKVLIVFHVVAMVDFQSRFRLYGHGYTAPETKYPVATYRELYHEQAPHLFKRRPKGKSKNFL